MASDRSESGPGGHISHAPIITPLMEGETPSKSQINYRVHAFRVILGQIGGFSNYEVRQWLEEQGWDLEVAIEVFRLITLPAARREHEMSQSERSLERRQKDRMLAAAYYSRHQNHRRSIDILYQILHGKYPDDPLSALRVAYLLRDNLFNLDHALERHEERRVNLTDLAELDRAELRLCMLPFNATQPNDAHKDMRIRDFLEIAGADDWVSAKAFLRSHSFHMGNAIDAWMKGGFPRTSSLNEDSASRKGYRQPQEDHFETDDMWPIGRPFFNLTTPDAADFQEANLDYGALPDRDQTAYYINLDLEHARPGVTRSDKLEQQYISKGKGTCWELNAAIEEGGIQIGNENINWFNADHVAAVNKAFNQNPGRKGGVKKRGTPCKYVPDETDFIYDWHRLRVDAYRNVNPAFALATGQTWNKVCDFSITDLEQEFNTRFRDSTVPGLSVSPHPGRDADSLNTKRIRMEGLCYDFGIKHQPSR